MKKLILFLLILIPVFAYSQTGTGWVQQRAKVNFKDDTYFAEIPIFDADIIMNGSTSGTTRLRPFAATSGTLIYPSSTGQDTLSTRAWDRTLVQGYLAGAELGVALADSNEVHYGYTTPLYNKRSDFDHLKRSVGMNYKGRTVGVTEILANGTLSMSDQALYIFVMELYCDTVVTGIRFGQNTQGVYTADNYNGVGIYSRSGTTLTRVAYTADDGNRWKTASYTAFDVAWDTPLTLDAGYYWIGIVCSHSALTTPPVLYGYSGFSGDLVNGSIRLAGYILNQTSMPASISMGSIVDNSGTFYAEFY